MLHFIFFSSSLLFLFFFSSFHPLFIPSSFSSFSLLFHPHPLFFLLFPPHFILYRNPTFCYFSYPFSVLLFFYHQLFDVMRLQRYAFIGQMTLLSSKSSGNPADGGKNPRSAPLEFNMKNDGDRRDRSVHVNHGTSSDTGAL
mgnify:CR=1 FL=1